MERDLGEASDILQVLTEALVRWFQASILL